MLVIYAPQKEHTRILREFPLARCEEIVSLWDCSLLERMYFEIAEGNVVIVVNPSFEILAWDSFVSFVHRMESSEHNLFFSPQINPKFFINEPLWFGLKKMDSVKNFFIEFLYKNQFLSTKFRNLMHKEVRTNSISRVDIPKYLTNLDSVWERFEDALCSNVFLESYEEKYFKNPTNVHVALSNRCNLSCVMCPYHSPQITPLHTSDFFKKAHFMDREVFREIAKFCGENQIFLQFGQLDEPLLHPHFIEFLEIAKSFDVPLNLTTNGTLLNEKIARSLAESSIKNIIFSLDAIDRESYAAIRGYDYDETLSNIERLISILKQNKKEVELGVCFILQGENPLSKSKEFLEYWISKVKRVKFHQLTQYERNADGILVSKNQGTFRDEKVARYPCSIPWKTLFITADMKVTFCCTSMAAYATSGCAGGGAYIGDLQKESLREIWMGERMRLLRKELMENTFDVFKVCERCHNWKEAEPQILVDYLENGMKVKKTIMDGEMIYEQE